MVAAVAERSASSNSQVPHTAATDVSPLYF